MVQLLFALGALCVLRAMSHDSRWSNLLPSGSVAASAQQRIELCTSYEFEVGAVFNINNIVHYIRT